MDCMHTASSERRGAAARELHRWRLRNSLTRRGPLAPCSERQWHTSRALMALRSAAASLSQPAMSTTFPGVGRLSWCTYMSKKRSNSLLQCAAESRVYKAEGPAAPKPAPRLPGGAVWAAAKQERRRPV